jgi:PEP-CTERM motif
VKYSNIYRTTLNTNSIYRVELRSDTNNYYYNQTLYFGAAKIALSIGLDVGLPENIVFSEGIGRTAVPEPSAWILMLFGFGLIGLGLRHKAGFRGHEFRARYTN